MKIGLTQRVLYYKGRAYDSIEHGWYAFLKNHTLTCIPNFDCSDYRSQELDLLIITGGDASALRTKVELRLIDEMLVQQKPIIGICHGAFLLTALLGGKIGEIADHQDSEHLVCYNNKEILVNSFHGMYIEQVPECSKVLCKDQDGHCEAWIANNVAAVVWHPERMATPWLPDEVTQLLK